MKTEKQSESEIIRGNERTSEIEWVWKSEKERCSEIESVTEWEWIKYRVR